MNDLRIKIIGTKGVKQIDSEFKIYSKEELIERITEYLDEGYGYSIVRGMK